MGSTSYTDEIAAIIRRAEAAAYERGKADAKRELLAFLGQKDADISAAPSPQADDSDAPTDGQSRPADERQRAPKGIVPKFVKRVLGSVTHGLSPQEMRAYAQDDFERMIKPASIRSELRNGRKAGRYIDRNGKWYLVSSEAEGGSGQDNPSASDDNNGGKSDAAALI